MTRLSASQSVAWCSLVREEGINEEGLRAVSSVYERFATKGVDVWCFIIAASVHKNKCAIT